MHYEPLDKTKNEIRVLRFLDLSNPISNKDPIHCSIENVPLKCFARFKPYDGCSQTQKFPKVWDVFTKCVDLQDSTLEQTKIDQATYLGLIKPQNQLKGTRYAWGDFEALSYTWGDGGDTRSIVINETHRNVSRNLEEALRVLRGLQETQLGMYYWVDSLCIDQENREERNEQVKRMKEIYSQARAIIVWLGEEESTDRNAVQTMRHLCRNPCVENTLHLPAHLSLHGWHALFAFTQNPYWNRAWIIQELAMNHNSTLILCGKSKLTRRMIRLGVIYCQKLLQASEDQSYQSNHYLDLDAWSMASRVYRLVSLNFKPNVEVDLNQLLNLVRRANATDKKDKVYGILGLLDPAISVDVIPNYSLSERQIYTDFMISIIRKSGKLEQITFGGIQTDEGWPSWVPDWRLPFGRHHIRYLRSRQASGNLPARIQFLKKGRNCDLLGCSGFEVDIVDGVAAQPSQRCDFTQSLNVSNRYGNQISGALEQTLLMDHPGATRKLLLETPWIPRFDTNSDPANSPSTSEWVELSKSSYFQKFHEFREYHQNFCISRQRFQDFFPQFGRKSVGRKSVDSVMMLRCMRLALLSLDQRALITTRTGYLGLAPIAVRPGDVVVILLGYNCPMVLRPYSDSFYRVIGECYIHGLMDGEILSQKSGENTSVREFLLY